ncbi:hypothetical protein ACFQ0R_00160 [Psychroflexus salinarum]|uniref:Uncharacterized protein n=1 Tax=Psychroflexus salinarum TaxID=546024 RepID=A0ABW3GKE0_9FLAO
MTANQRKLDQNDIPGFEIYGQAKYKSVKVDIDISENPLSDLSRDRLPNVKEQHLLLKVLEEGQANLYTYSKGTFTRYFL